MANGQLHGNNYFNPVKIGFNIFFFWKWIITSVFFFLNQAVPPPQTPSTNAAGQSDGRNNVHLVGATLAAATVNTIAAHSTPFAVSKPLKVPKKVEVTKIEHHPRFPYECTDCRKVFGNHSELKRHQQNCSRQSFRCACCKQSFGTLKGKQGHEYKMHSDIFKHSCSECKRAFKRRDDLIEHRKCHKYPSIKCDFCSKMVCTQYGKEYHIKKRHSDRKYHCKLCDGKGFSSSSGNTMRKHYTDKHGGVPAGGI